MGISVLPRCHVTRVRRAESARGIGWLVEALLLGCAYSAVVVGLFYTALAVRG